MTPVLYAAIAIGAVALVFLWRRGGGAGVGRLVDEAVAKGDAEPVLAAAAKLSHEVRSRFFQQAISILWEGWHRPLAVQVIKAFAEAHASEKICQFWLKQAQEVEPLEVQKRLGPDFLKAHYRPEVAACCGKTSS